LLEDGHVGNLKCLAPRSWNSAQIKHLALDAIHRFLDELSLILLAPVIALRDNTTAMVKDISEVVRASLSVHPFLQDYFVKLSDFEVFDDLKEHVALDEHILQEIACLGVISLGSENIDERFYLFLVKQLWVDITNSL